MNLRLVFKVEGDVEVQSPWNTGVTAMGGKHSKCRALVGLGGGEQAQVPRSPNPAELACARASCFVVLGFSLLVHQVRELDIRES